MGVKFASGERFVESMRTQGLIDEDAIKEFVDNSFDKDSSEVNIFINKKNILIQDDGQGMNKELLDSALAFGQSDNDLISDKIGKFGFGMSSAIIGKTRFAKVYSKIKGGNWHSIELNLDEISKDPEMEIKESKKDNPFKDKFIKEHIKEIETGTIIFLQNCDKLRYKTDKKLVKSLKEDLGETYRKFITKGKKIKINNEVIEEINPFYIEKKGKYYDVLKKFTEIEGIAESSTLSEVYLDELISIPLNKEDKNAKGYIKLKIYYLPYEIINKYKDKTKGTDEGNDKTFGIALSKSGFYLIRNGRQIAGGKTLGFSKKHNDYNYIRGEIDFDSILDEGFGIQNNKSRFHLTEEMEESLGKIICLTLDRIVKKHQELRNKLLAEKKKKNELAQKISDTTSLPRTKEQKEIISEGLKKVKEKIIEDIKESSSLTEKQKEERIQNIEKTFREEHEFEIETIANGQGPIFTWEYQGKTTKIFINLDHPFGKYYWISSDDSYSRTLIELLIYSLVKVEQNHVEETQMGNSPTYEQLHRFWSLVLDKYLTNPRFLDWVNSVEQKWD